ncbi:MAG: GGDEF domain-containing protein [Burkholderiaceae bacterium]|nr:MAG: GGDEF domain-containing protein [Burkholderiaceae bacterium]
MATQIPAAKPKAAKPVGATAPDLNNPTDVAREAIKRLALQRIAPTPEAYSRAYAEISGQPLAGATHPLLGSIKQLAAELRESGPGRRVAQPLSQALEQGQWDEVRQTLLKLAQGEQEAPQHWPDLLRDLLRQWELRQEGLTQARKRDALEHVLNTFGGQAARLYQRLRALTKSWAEGKEQAGETLVDDESSGAPGPQHFVAHPAAEAQVPIVHKSAQEIASTATVHVRSPDQEVPALRDLLAQTMTYAVTQRLGYSEEMERAAANLAQRCRHTGTLADINLLSVDLRQFWVQLELRGETLDQMVKGLLTLLQLLVHNMSELMEDDRWVTGQVARMQNILDQPLSPKGLEAATEGFREFIHRQGVLKTSLDEAKQAIRNMVQVFVERLSVMSESTGVYSERIEGYAEQIRTANDLPKLSHLVENLMNDTRTIQAEMVRSHDELKIARKQVQEYEQRVADLQTALQTLSELISHDSLTNTLNRRGMEQLFEIEVARCDRRQKPLSLAMLDIDNFKQLNDLLGHQAGDQALAHLSTILRQVVRPTDAVARYGGEEFVIILPETSLQEAERVIVRVQRELTKRFFLHNNEKVLITFSAGVSMLIAGESRDDLIKRADQAMYQAKRAGKNRVQTA